MLIRKPDIPGSEITPKGMYVNRRKFITGVAATAAAVAGGVLLRDRSSALAAAPSPGKLPGFSKSKYTTDEKQTPLKDIANLLGLPADTVKSRYGAALKHLRDSLKPYYPSTEV